MATKEPYTREQAKADIDEAVRILREDAQLAHNRQLMKRLDNIERQTFKEPQTPEEKAAAYDKLMAERNKPPTTSNTGDPTPATTTTGPLQPPPKPPEPPKPTAHDFWWGDQPNE